MRMHPTHEACFDDLWRALVDVRIHIDAARRADAQAETAEGQIYSDLMACAARHEAIAEEAMVKAVEITRSQEGQEMFVHVAGLFRAERSIDRMEPPMRNRIAAGSGVL